MPKENKKGSSLARIALPAEYTFSIYKAVTVLLERIYAAREFSSPPISQYKFAPCLCPDCLVHD